MLHLSTVEPITLGLLKELMTKSYLETFTLVGGTALSLQIGHRISIDLDLFSTDIFDHVELKEHLGNDFPNFHIDLARSNTLITRIMDVKVDFIRFKYGFNYPVVIENELRLANIGDIASMKLDAISGRGRKKDFFDLFFLLKSFSLPEMLDLYKKKYQHTTIFHVIKSLSYFADAESDPDPYVFDKNLTWNRVKNAIKKEIKKL